MNTLTASVLIRTKNEAASITKALELINNQSVTAHEIIVVDSGSTDGTIEIVQQWSDVKLIQMPAHEFTFGRSLNLGCKAATGNIVVSISAHAFPSDQYWLEKLVKHFENSKVAGVYGRQLPQPDAWPPVQRDYLGFYGDRPKIQVDATQPSDRTFSNANSAFRRACWEQRPFNESLTGAEDHEWAWAMLKLGYQIVYEPQAAVYHSHNESHQKLFHRSYRETLAINALYNHELSLYRAVRNWFRWISADFKFILQTKQDWRWLFKVPVYRAFEAFGCLRTSSFHGLLGLPAVQRRLFRQIQKLNA
jgi:rhamnosyltransferase